MIMPLAVFLWAVVSIAILAISDGIGGFIAFTCWWLIMAGSMIAWEQKRGGEE